MEQEKSIFRLKNRTFYKNRFEALQRKTKNDKIYFVAGVGYYIVRPKKKGIWW